MLKAILSVSIASIVSGSTSFDVGEPAESDKVCTDSVLDGLGGESMIQQILSRQLAFSDYTGIVNWFKAEATDHPNDCLRCLGDVVVAGEAGLAAECSDNPAQCPSALSRLAGVVIDTCVAPAVGGRPRYIMGEIESTMRRASQCSRYDLADSRNMFGQSPPDRTIWAVGDISQCMVSSRRTPSGEDNIETCIRNAALFRGGVIQQDFTCTRCLSGAIRVAEAACFQSAICPTPATGSVLGEQSGECQQCLKSVVEAEVAKCTVVTEMYPSMQPSCNATESEVAIPFAESHLRTCASLVNPVLGSAAFQGCAIAVRKAKLPVTKFCTTCVTDASAAVVTRCAFECALDNSLVCEECISAISSQTLNECNSHGQPILYDSLAVGTNLASPTLLSVIGVMVITAITLL